MRLITELLAQLVAQPRLPDAGLALHEHRLSHSVDDALPRIREHAELALPADEGRVTTGREVEPTAHAARLHDAIEDHRLRHPFELVRAAFFDDEESCDQPLRGRADHHRVGCRRRLHACRNVRRVAEHVLRLARTVRDDRRSGVHADAHLQPPRRRAIEVSHRVDDRQPGAHCALGVIFVRLWHAEEAHQTVAEILVDMAAEAGHRGGGSLLVVFRDRMPLFRIELRGDLGRADQVAEEHGQLPAFAGSCVAARRMPAALP